MDACKLRSRAPAEACKRMGCHVEQFGSLGHGVNCSSWVSAFEHARVRAAMFEGLIGFMASRASA